MIEITLPTIASTRRGLWVVAALAALPLLHPARPAWANAPIWANAKVVKATHTDCGALKYLTLKANGVKLLSR